MTNRSEGGMIVVLSGPSGSGKTTICSRLLKKGNYARSVSVTTRPPRPGESNGKDYWFTSKDDFLRKVKEGYFAEHAEYCGHLYGTPLKPLQEALAKGRVMFLVIEVDGARQIQERFPDALSIFIEPPSSEEAERRLRNRNQDSPTDIVKRRGRAGVELERASQYDYVIVNDDLDTAVKTVEETIVKERNARLKSG